MTAILPEPEPMCNWFNCKADVKVFQGELMEGNTKKSLVITRILVMLGAVAIVAFVFLVFFVPERPNLKAANASAAASSLRIIYLSNEAYAEKHLQQGYVSNLSDLARRPSQAKPGEDTDWMIDPGLASGEKTGYKFAYTAQSTKGDGKLDAFQVTADPLLPGKTGIHHLFVDQTGVIRMSETGPANTSSAALQ